jgi:nucleoside-diphosphate-sugar epimerase
VALHAGQGRVLITGGNSFIGRAVADHLSTLGFEVDARGRERLDVTAPLVLEAGFDHVVHVAGRTGVMESWHRPQEFIRINVEGTVNLLDYCRRTGCSLTFLSAYVYGSSVRGPVSEKEPAQPENPYALSKRLAEIACEFFASKYGLCVTVLRLFNVYGPGQSDRFLIPTVLRNLLDASVETIEVDSVHPRRDYIYVADVASAVAATLKRSGFGLFNVGSGVSHSVAEVIETAMNISGIHKAYRARGIDRPNELFDTVADNSELCRVSGWIPSVTLAVGVATIIGAMRGP